MRWVGRKLLRALGYYELRAECASLFEGAKALEEILKSIIEDGYE